MEGEAADLRSYAAFKSNFFSTGAIPPLDDTLKVNNRKSDVNHPPNELAFIRLIPNVGILAPH